MLKTTSKKSRNLARRASRHSRPLPARLEILEARTLLSSVTSFTIPGVLAQAGAYDVNDNLWVLNFDGDPSLDRIAGQVVAESVDLTGTSPISVAAAPNGHLFIADGNRAILDVNPNTLTYTSYAVPDVDTYSEVPIFLTVTSNGAVWFTAAGDSFTDIGGINHTVNVIGRMDPGDQSFTFSNLSTVDADSEGAGAISISASGSDSVLVALQGADDFNFQGFNQIAAASFSSGINASVINVDPGATAGENGHLTHVVTNGDGTVWFNLANVNQTSNRTITPADRLVNGTISGVTFTQTGSFTVPGATDTNPLATFYLAFDGEDRIWFNETQGSNVHAFDTVAQTFETFAYPAGTTTPNTIGPVIAAQGISEVTVLSFDQDFPIIQIVSEVGAGFSGAASNLSGAEDVAFTNIELALFSAPPLPSGTYSATISWGNGPNTSGTVTSLGGNNYKVTVASKTFSTQGVFNGTVTILDNNGAVVGSLPFTSNISDTPLQVTSFSVNNIIGRIVLATLTFTDDFSPAAPASTFSVLINWGDSTSSNGIVIRDVANPGRYFVIALHRYSARGTYNVSASITTSEVNATLGSNTANTTITV